MKRITIIILVSLFAVCTYAQKPLELKIVRGADKPNYELTQKYLFEISNITTAHSNFVISTEDVKCPNISIENQVDLNQKVLNEAQTDSFNSSAKNTSGTIGNSQKFHVEISRSSNAPKNKWNCTEVKAVSQDGDVLSNTILIKSLIPNSSKVN